MKILFIHKQIFMFFGVTALLGYVKKHGHKADVLIGDAEQNLVDKIKDINPDIIGFSIMSNDEEWFLDLSKEVKKTYPDIPIIVGGAHTYLCRETVLDYPQIDMVCIGEGEIPVVELLNRMQNKQDYTDIKGISFKVNGKIIANPPQPPIQDMDEIPEDRDIYIKKYPIFTHEELLQLFSSRGCYYNCTFCINGVINKLYRRMTKVHRQKSPQALINQIKDLLPKFPETKTVYFADDLFLANKTFVKEFSVLYKKEIGMPFLMNVFPVFIDNEVVKCLADAGCITIQVGTETGNEEHRKKIFKKPVSNAQYIEMSETAKKHGLRVYASSMFVYPDQTLDDAFKTVELMHAMKTDHPFKGFFQPYPGTVIYDMSVEKGYINSSYSFKDLPHSYFKYYSLDIPEKKDIALVCHFYYFLVKMPKLYRFLKKHFWILRLLWPFKMLFNYLGIFLWFKEWKNMGYIKTFLYLWKFRKNA
ncbi:MAG: B12-binding domain-containing radical SAM protein [Spirochaetes bacterium]|nr:B12-binding domain-containing radical SAM protein [Spirochaetota bacterium]